MEIQSNAAMNYSALKPATQPGESTEKGAVYKTFADFVDTLKSAEDVSKGAINGRTDPHVLVEALAQSELAVDTAVAVRNKVLEAYQEILRMPV